MLKFLTTDYGTEIIRREKDDFKARASEKTKIFKA